MLEKSNCMHSQRKGIWKEKGKFVSRMHGITTNKQVQIYCPYEMEGTKRIPSIWVWMGKFRTATSDQSKMNQPQLNPSSGLCYQVERSSKVHKMQKKTSPPALQRKILVDKGVSIRGIQMNFIWRGVVEVGTSDTLKEKKNVYQSNWYLSNRRNWYYSQALAEN